MNKAYVHPSAIVDATAVIGNGTKIWHFAHVRENARIGQECVLGHSVYVGMGVNIGNHVKLENRATVYQGVTIEDNVFIGPHVTFTNDLYPRSLAADWSVRPTLVKKGSSIGAGTIIICAITIGEYAMIGAGSTVTRDIPPHALAYGNPARIQGFVCQCGRRLTKAGETQQDVLMNCSSCGKEHKISKKNYAEITK
ncbi:MAG: N-acetyltransferase [Candidatus Bathyarchaeota archaeon]|nr:MAG: N-acetyltransferase [Candidatus Bathyarchaeota archaeon]